MKIICFILFTIAIINAKSQTSDEKINYIYQQGIDSIQSYINIQGTSVYQDWIEINKPPSHKAFCQLSDSFNFLFYIDTLSKKIDQYTLKRVFNYFIDTIDNASSFKVVNKNYVPTTGCYTFLTNTNQFDWDSKERRVKCGNQFYEKAVLKSSCVYIFNAKYAIWELTLYRGFFRHGVSFYFFYKYENDKWRLENKTRDISIYDWL